jgi:hypothetical protein
MPEKELCDHCNKVVDTRENGGDDFVIVRVQTGSAPRRIAHVGCEQKHASESGGTSQLGGRGGSWESE